MASTKPRLRFRDSAIRLAAFVLLFSLCGCTYALVKGGEINQTEADSIRRQIQEIRELQFKRTVPTVVRTPEQVRGMIVADLKRDYTDEQLQADGKAGAMLGLYPRGIDLKAATVNLLEDQVASFYDPHSKEMVLVAGALKLDFMASAEEFLMQRDLGGEMLLAHELTQALQDQNFELEKGLDSVRYDGDRAIALKSIAEGDATIAGFACVAGRMNDSIAGALTQSLTNLPRIFAAQAKGTPEGLAEPLIFQYSEGVRFVAEAYRRGGWKAVDKLYSKPPESTQQIIEPALYFDHFTPPAKVVVAGYEALLSGWKQFDRDSYGALLLRIILERNFGKKSSETALSRRWAGDRLIVLGRGTDVTALWMIVFRDRDSAQRFAALYAPLLDLASAPPRRITCKRAPRRCW